ncbi:STAS domain-containing protein [Actinosynnema sp. NPDC023658]|uniref:STAS domain-containing protein n=1 Tax=Actinosynnema sp. NPDC023658 TaxID=3155465 RepID=UPI0033FD532E
MGDNAWTIPPTTVTASVRGGVPVIGVVGDIDMACATPIRDAVAAQLHDRPANLVMDLTEVGLFGSTAIQLLVEAVTRGEDQGTVVVVATNRRGVLRSVAITSVDAMVAIHPSVQHALAALSSAEAPTRRHRSDVH